MKKAVVLKYPQGSYAPFITAKAKGDVANRLIEIAKKNNVEIVENDLLTDVLTLQKIGSYVPEETWEVLAGIFAFVLKMQKQNK